MQGNETKHKFNVKKEMKMYWDRQLNIEILQSEKKDLEWDMENQEPSCVQTLSDMPRGSGTSDPTANTSATREKIAYQMKKKEREIWKEESRMKRVECLIKTQIQEDQDLLNLRVKENRRWENIQDILWPKYHRYTHFKSVERRYNDLVNKMQQKINQIENREE